MSLEFYCRWSSTVLSGIFIIFKKEFLCLLSSTVAGVPEFYCRIERNF
jgi:hypothetical protein